VIIAESQGGEGVRLEGEDAQGQAIRVWADKIIVDTTARTLRAQGNARVERTRQIQRKTLDSSPLLQGLAPKL
jgi:pyruvate carboxylase